MTPNATRPRTLPTPIFRTEEPLWFLLETAWCSQTQMGLSESTVWDLQSLMGARQMWTLGDAGMGPSDMPLMGVLAGQQHSSYGLLHFVGVSQLFGGLEANFTAAIVPQLLFKMVLVAVVCR
ncbi:hypothetical protein FJT64_004618 [Amphibalanus amphitrite]|uniref:Uncharacterized protein n=1 Tax=Amphibalanus amphitrite TaxID=1232801 RepID=A0A6A4VPB9_AMPAM|nr:hypothetical protein FJT64_004618 [Amphibalanus amphitrite]